MVICCIIVFTPTLIHLFQKESFKNFRAIPQSFPFYYIRFPPLSYVLLSSLLRTLFNLPQGMVSLKTEPKIISRCGKCKFHTNLCTLLIRKVNEYVSLNDGVDITNLFSFAYQHLFITSSHFLQIFCNVSILIHEQHFNTML